MLAELCDMLISGFGKPSRCGRPERGRRAGVNGNVTLIILDKKVQGFQDPKTSRGMADMIYLCKGTEAGWSGIDGLGRQFSEEL